MTNLSAIHLSEEERQRAADGTLEAADRARVDAHLGVCRDCASDVARLTALMNQIDESRRATAAPLAPPPELEGMWPRIRQQIESGKVVALDSDEPAATSWRSRVDPWVMGVAASVAAITALTVIQVVPPIVRSVGMTAASAVAADSAFRFADDSITSYRAEADQLLDELQLQRARLAPGTRAAIDDELKTVDLAIAELQAAVTRDPRNPTLRTLLASSYRQKIDVLKKVSNAS
jgi:anti-sigma factor RsiW